MRTTYPLDLRQLRAERPAPARLRCEGLSTGEDLRPRNITNSSFLFCSDLTPTFSCGAYPGEKMLLR